MMDGLGCLAVMIGVLMLVGYLMWDAYEQHARQDLNDEETDDA